MSRIHPFTGEPLNGKAVNGSRRADLAAIMPVTMNRRAKLSYDAARSGNDWDGHWQFSDALDADASNNQRVRHTLIKRSRYESGSNGYYAGIIRTHCNMLVGVGPSLRMLTGSRDFNQLVEREFFAWMQQVQLRRKLWCMAHARTQDGETFAVLRTNPMLRGRVQLDFMPIEAEQVQTPYLPYQTGYIDGIKYDEYGNIEWYDVLPYHPGGDSTYINTDPIQVPPQNMLHWFRLERPGAHRGIPDCTSTLNVGASSRRHREATIAAAETAADIAVMLTTQLGPSGSDEPDLMAPFSSVPFEKRMMVAAPMGWSAAQMEGKHPNAEYANFHRLQISEQARPLSMPYNAAACDSSTYSFASGKLDTLCYRAALDVERQDANDLVLDPLFAAWFREWTVLTGRRDIPPFHQWDWPAHPVIDEVAHSAATQTRLATGATTLREVHSEEGKDYEDTLAVQAEDTFGEATPENIEKCRKINVLKNTPAHAVQFVAQLLGVETQQQGEAGNGNEPQPLD